MSVDSAGRTEPRVRPEPCADVVAPLAEALAPLAEAFALLAELGRVAWVPDRPAAAPVPPPDVQFDLTPHVPPSRLIDGIRVRFGPVHTVFATAVLERTPTREDQQRLADALATVEAAYPWRPGGLFLHVAYGLPYFRRLPRGLFDLYVPRRLADTARFVLTEAQPAPADTRVRIETNDLLLTLRSDVPDQLADVLAWFTGSDRLAGYPVDSPRLPVRFTSGRVAFTQPGLPAALAVRHGLRYAERLNPRSPTWMGLLDNQPEPGTTAPAVTFRRAATTAQAGDYFDEGVVQHLAHTLLDLPAFYEDAGFTERVRCLFRDVPVPRAPGAVPLHERIDGPGLDAMDVPGGAVAPKLHFAVFVPDADHFVALRRDHPPADLERFLTATRRQNFLVPPRRHRAFPLLELA